MHKIPKIDIIIIKVPAEGSHLHLFIQYFSPVMTPGVCGKVKFIVVCTSDRLSSQFKYFENRSHQTKFKVIETNYFL